MLNSGFLIDNPTDFTLPLQKLLKLGFGMRKDAPIEEIEIDISQFDEEEDVDFEEEDEEGEIEEEEMEFDSPKIDL